MTKVHFHIWPYVLNSKHGDRRMLHRRQRPFRTRSAANKIARSKSGPGAWDFGGKIFQCDDGQKCQALNAALGIDNLLVEDPNGHVLTSTIYSAAVAAFGEDGPKGWTQKRFTLAVRAQLNLEAPPAVEGRMRGWTGWRMRERRSRS